MQKRRQYSLQLLLDADSRSPAAKLDIKEILESLGIEPSGEGEATLSGRISAENFQKLFDRAPGDELRESALPVPKRLKASIRSISVAPDHLQFKKR